MQKILKWQMAALAVALVALTVSAALFWRFLSHGTVQGRAVIPPAQIQHASGFRYVWRVPAALRAAPWYRAEVRVWEDGKPLPLRVEDSEVVALQGKGRFGLAPFSVGMLQEELVWFSASDNSSPANNGRKYEFEMRRTPCFLAVLPGVALALAMVGSLFAVPIKIWRRLIESVVKPSEPRALRLRRLSVFLAVLAAIILTQTWPSTRIVRRIDLPAARWIQSEEHYFYRLPRWIDQDVAAEFAVLYEDRHPMKRRPSWAWQSESGNGSFYCPCQGSLVRVCLRTGDGSSPAINGHAYAVEIPVLPPRLAPPLAALLGFVGLLLFISAPGLDSGRCSKRARRFHEWFRTIGWRWAVLMLGLAKLWVVAGDEVWAQICDAHLYARSVNRMVWGAGLPEGPAGYPFIAGIVAQLGVPWRLALEALYLACCSILAAGILSLLRSSVIAVLLFAAMVWHPWTFSGFHDFWSYPFLLVLSVALLGVMSRILCRPSNQWTWPIFIGTGCVLFFWQWCRNEEPLVYGTYVLFTALAWALSRYETNPQPWRQRAALLVLPVLMVFVLSTSVKFVNYFRYGVCAKSKITAPGIMTLMKTLYQVKPEGNLRYAPVTRQSLQAACRVSPTLRQFESTLLNPRNPETKAGEAITQLPGEFGSWLISLLLNSLPWDSREQNQVMLVAASEINEALRDGRLPRRHASYPLDPNWRLWLPDLLPSFAASLRSASSIKRWQSWRHEVTGSPYLEHDFDEAANRRAAGAYSPLLLVEGSVQPPMPSVDSVAVLDQRGRLLAASPLPMNSLEGSTVFHLRSTLPTEPVTFRLAFFHEGKSRFSEQGWDSAWWATNRYTVVTNTAVLPGTGEKITYSYRLSDTESKKKARFWLWEAKAETLCKVLLWAAGFAALFTGLSGETSDKARFRRVLACLILLAGWLAGRAALYAYMDAALGTTIDRYMRCVSPLFVLSLVLAATVVASLLKSLIDTVSRSKAPNGGESL